MALRRKNQRHRAVPARERTLRRLEKDAVAKFGCFGRLRLIRGAGENGGENGVRKYELVGGENGVEKPTGKRGPFSPPFSPLNPLISGTPKKSKKFDSRYDVQQSAG